MSRLATIIAELRRREVFRAAGIYIVAAWVVVQVADLVFPAFNVPESAIAYVWLLVILLFPGTMIASWYFEMTWNGLIRTPPTPTTVQFDPSLRHKDYMIISALLLLSGAIAFQVAMSIGEIGSVPEPGGKTKPNSIAVLPLENLSGDPGQQYFSDGISEELINALARLPGLHVAARTSSFQFAGSRRGNELIEIARQLGVATLVEGSVRRVGDRIRVTASLINAEDGFQMWSESFDREMTDIFDIQDKIAGDIAIALQVQLAMEGAMEPSVPRTASIDAYNLYLLGRYHFEKRTTFELGQAQRYFEDAIERDPLYIPAYNGLVDSLLLQSDFAYGDVPLEQAIESALPLIDRSLKLDPFLAETHASLGFLRMFERDLSASEAALLRAIELSPSLSRAHLWLYVTYQQQIQHRKAFEILKRTFALDPLSPIVNTNLAAEWWIRSNISEALQACQRVIQIAPDGPLGYRRSGRIKWTSGAMAEAVGEYRKSLEVTPEGPNSKLELGSLLVDLGFFEEAESLLGEYRYIAYLAQGRVEEALSIVRASLKKRPRDLRTIVAAARTELRAGNIDQVRLLLEPLADGYDTEKRPLFQPYGVHFWDPQVAALDLVVARLESGDRETGLALLSEVKDHFEFLKNEGLDHPMLSFQEARILALEGNLHNALGVLRRVIAAGWRFWYLDGDPALKNLQQSQEFHTILDDRNMLVEIERAKIAND